MKLFEVDNQYFYIIFLVLMSMAVSCSKKLRGVEIAEAITIQLDSIVLHKHFYKMHENEDGYKRLLFFISDYESGLEEINERHGGTYINKWLGTPENGERRFLSYVVFGHKWKGNWYYNVGEYREVIADSENTVFLKTISQIIDKDIQDNSQISDAIYHVWDNYPYKIEENESTSTVVIHAELLKNKINYNKMDDYYEGFLCSLRDSIVISNEYQVIGHEKCNVLYDSTYSIGLIPIVFVEVDTMISYHVFIKGYDKTLKWSRYENERVVLDSDKPLMNVIYDLRDTNTGMMTYGWGTRSRKNNDKFWQLVRNESVEK